MKVYVVCELDATGYNIRKIFTTVEKALQYKRWLFNLQRTQTWIDEWEVEG